MVVLRYSGIQGSKGASGSSGKDGQKGGGNGYHGTDGTDGGNGKDCGQHQIVISAGPKNELIIDGKKSNEVIGTPQCSIEVYAEGGSGGDGGNGGNGGRGGEGKQGRNAQLGVPGTDGEKGGDGGDGGKGGNGGNGGNGGYVIFSVSQNDTDLLYLLKAVNVAGGQSGSAGKGGQAGNQGQGGSGGNQFIGVNGQKGQRGGYKGIEGRKGKQGMDGKKGDQGYNGKYCFHVLETNTTYDQLFNLVMGDIKIIQSPDQIIEPGETFKTEVILTNNTTMSTPTGNPITISLLDDPLIQQNTKENVFEYSQSIPGGQTITLPKQFEFKIAQNFNPKINTPLNDIYKLKFKGILNRVKADFKGINSYEQQIRIEYPVELTYVSAPRSYLDDEEIPFVIGVKNKSTKPLGIKNGRLVNLRFYNEGKAGGIKFTPYSKQEDELIDQNNNDPFAKKALDQANFVKANQDIKSYELIKQVFIPNINAGETIYFKGSVKVVDPTIQAYDCACLRFCLDLGYIDDPVNKYQTIQENVFKVQKSEQLQFKDKSEVVMIINTEIERESILKIRESLRVLGTDCDIYSISQYKQFYYNFDPQNKKKAPHENKAVVIFANLYNDYQNKKTNAFKEIGLENIYKSSYMDDTRNYIMGSSQYVNYGRLFNYSAINLYRGSIGDELRPTFPYQKNIEIVIPDLALTYIDFSQKIRQIYPNNDDEEEQGVELIDDTSKPINTYNLRDLKKLEKGDKKLPEELAKYIGVEQESQLLFQGEPQQKLKNIELIAKYFKENPKVIASIENEDTGYRLKLGEGENISNHYDEKNIIVNQIKSVHEALSKHDPSRQYHTRHFFVNEEDRSPDLLEVYIGKKYKSSGYQNIARGLRKDCAQIAFRDKGEAVPVVDDGDIYNILKIIDVAKKIGFIKTFTGNNETLADMLFSSIASDLCDEFKAFTSVSYRSGWKAPQYLEAMKGWKAIHDFNFESLVSSKNVFLLKKFLVMIQCVIEVVSDRVNFFVKACCCSCIPIPSSIVLTVCKNAQKTIVSKINACEGASDKVSELVSQKFAKANNSQLKFDAISRPDRLLSKGTSFYSNQSSCIVNVFDPVPVWIKQELQFLEQKPKKQIKIEISSTKKVYQNDQQRKEDIDKFIKELTKQKS